MHLLYYDKNILPKVVWLFLMFFLCKITNCGFVFYGAELNGYGKKLAYQRELLAHGHPHPPPPPPPPPPPRHHQEPHPPNDYDYYY